jgi:signal transduction histidine kinase
MLRCAQEIATNAARHSQAGNLWLTLSLSSEEL